MPELLIHNPQDFLLHIPQILDHQIIFLHGELGAGKTTFVKKVGEYLGVTRPIVSPTFTYIREYTTAQNTKLYHLDLYRFSGNIEDILSLKDLRPEDRVFIEWPEMVPELATIPHRDIMLKHHNETTRLLLW